MKPVALLVTAGLIGIAGAAGWWFGHQSSAGALSTGDGPAAKDWVDELPSFTDPPPGQRAPHTAFAGLKIGFSGYAEVQQVAAGWGVSCRNTSVRAMMAHYRDKKRQESEVDGHSGATWLNRQTKHERNPQVRMTCEGVALERLGVPHLQGTGRVLLIFDSPEHPLRHVAVQRRHEDHPSAVADLARSEQAWTQVFGVPTEMVGPAPSSDAPLPPYKLYRRDWRFSDLAVKVSALNMGKHVHFTEEIGVPWPVRSDAPQAVARK